MKKFKLLYTVFVFQFFKLRNPNVSVLLKVLLILLLMVKF